MIYKAYAKVNIFLKIVALRGSYHEIVSRFMLVNDIFDELKFSEKKDNSEFELYGEFGCDLKSNTIYKAYKSLLDNGYNNVRDFMQNYSLHVKKKIPSFAGLGGGSSDAAAFLKMINQEASLNIDDDKLAYIGSKVGADIPFFIYGYKSANVSGIGEIVEEFEEDSLDLELLTPKILCDTSKVYKEFRKEICFDIDMADILKQMQSNEIVEKFTLVELNDLFKPAKRLYRDLEKYEKKGWFFSGSGSSFFRKK